MAGEADIGEGGRLFLRCFGGAALERHSATGRVEVLLEPSKLLALLVYLNAAPARAATRDHLVHLLWSDPVDIDGRHALRHQLWLLKQKLGDLVSLKRTGEALRLEAAIPSDCERMRQAATDGDVLSVISLYRGDFFPGFAAGGAQEFERGSIASAHPTAPCSSTAPSWSWVDGWMRGAHAMRWHWRAERATRNP